MEGGQLKGEGREGRERRGRRSASAATALHTPPRTVMKSGPEIVKAGLRSFFESASEDIEKMVENLRLGKVSQARTQVKGVGQNLTYTTVALLPVLTTLFQHIAQHQFGDDVIRKDSGHRGQGGGVGSASPTVPSRGAWGSRQVLEHVLSCYSQSTQQ